MKPVFVFQASFFRGYVSFGEGSSNLVGLQRDKTGFLNRNQFLVMHEGNGLILRDFYGFVPSAVLSGFMQEAYCCVAENLESSSYPGFTAAAMPNQPGERGWGEDTPNSGFRCRLAMCVHHPLLRRAALGQCPTHLSGAFLLEGVKKIHGVIGNLTSKKGI